MSDNSPEMENNASPVPPAENTPPARKKRKYVRKAGTVPRKRNKKSTAVSSAPDGSSQTPSLFPEETVSAAPADSPASPPVPAAKAGPAGKRRAAPRKAVPSENKFTQYLLLAVVLLGYLLVVPPASFYQKWIKTASVITAQSSYLRYGFIDIIASVQNLAVRKKWTDSPPVAGIFYQDNQIESIGGIKEVPLVFDPGSGRWKGRFPVPWNPPRGKYTVKLLNSGLKGKYVSGSDFEITKRELPSLKQSFAVLTLEYAGWYGSLSVKSLSGQKVPAPEGLADWAKYMGVDALWVLVGKTTGRNGQIWDPVDFKTLAAIGDQCHRRGIKFGVWVMSYLTFPEKVWPDYQWAYDVADGKPVRVRSVSISDPKRPDDIADLLVKFRDMKEIDFVGLDYIRNALGGYELCEEFYNDMWWINKPAGWDRMSHDQRIVAFARKKIERKDRELLDAWEWWRAQKVAGIVNHIKGRLGDDKMLWTYTLGWNKGWQHGQDPAMIVDAGSDIDAVMLYEADNGQYDTMMRDWSSYLERGDTRLVVGDIVDAPLHQGKGTSEFVRRMNWAGDEIFGKENGYAHGVFIHDLMRLMYGRKGSETMLDWAQAAKGVIMRHKKLYGSLPEKKAEPAAVRAVPAKTGNAPSKKAKSKVSARVGT
ncbi:MAG: hypothetical protein WCS77_10680 [Elusimicrobiaceae bacterium]